MSTLLEQPRPTFDDQRAMTRNCPRNRHALTGGVEAWAWLTCPYCEAARPVARFGAVWIQPDMERGE